ncbi:MAG: hypothetical protein WCD53_07120, partial [Microcoleus sp.]
VSIGDESPQNPTYIAVLNLGEVCPMPYALCPMPYALCPMPYALCPMPYALCPMPYALCPPIKRAPHCY